jgi:hypothetical protein
LLFNLDIFEDFWPVSFGKMGCSQDASDRGLLGHTMRQRIQMIAKAVAQDPLAILLVGRSAGAKMDRISPFAFQDAGQCHYAVSRTAAGKKPDQFAPPMAGKTLRPLPKAMEAPGQRTTRFVFFATNQTDLRHAALLSIQ